MRLQRFVWVLDIHDFLLYLDDCLYRLGHRYRWLHDTQPLRLSGPWTQIQVDEPKTQKDGLVDWLLRYVLSDFYAFRQILDPQPEYQAIYDALEDEFALHTHLKLYTDFPFLMPGYGDIITHHITRQACWLYIEASFDPTQQPR